uniref:Integrase n=2 Tax=Rhizobium/Agrobacterium group TaxID=227290 RepID=A0A2Z2PLS1_AGRTU|nr:MULTISPECIES: hypothetical protein [Rhizobium/Agrobacterium group]ASK43678.1 hypothetical protein [Agrobacterium radiobacter]ASK43808.1 hypothetical protein [Rhizobium rhizogenes]
MKQQKFPSDAIIRSRYRSAADVVLASMPLHEGIDRSTLSRFGDDRWDLSPAIFQTRVATCERQLNFTTIECPIELLTAKEYIYTGLNERFSEGRRPLRPISARNALRDLIRFMAFVRGQLGRFDIQMIDQDLLDAFRSSLEATTADSAKRVSRYAKPISDLHLFGPWLTSGGLTFPPWGGRPIYRVAGVTKKHSENRTPRIPEPIIGALLHWSLKYVDLFSADIFAAREELTTLENNCASLSSKRATNVAGRIAAWVETRRESRRGIPVWDEADRAGWLAGARRLRKSDIGGEVINFRLIAMQTGLGTQTVYATARARQIIRDAVAELGVERGGMETLITIDPDTGRPWRGRFDQLSLEREEKHLQSAAYVLCAYLTGMRDGEVQAMQPDCVTRSLSADGMIERLAVRSTIFKDRGARGEDSEWITIEPVDRAVAVAQRLVARRCRKNDDLWFILDRNGHPDGRGIVSISEQINRFRAHIDERYGTADQPAIPLFNGQPWSFNTRQFRRTLAWYIANRPFGVIAGKIQYKHASVAMFDGYAGSSVSGFRQEVEQERAFGQMDDVVAQYEAYCRGQKLGGPVTSRLTAEYDRIRHELEPLPGRIADTGRLRAMLSHLARTLHVGYLNDCFFEPATALCLDKDKSTEPPVPALPRCSPDRCPNACITPRHLPVWQASIEEADRLLQDKRLPRFQREALQRDNERKRKLIAPLTIGDPS